MTFHDYLQEPGAWTDRQMIFIEFAKREPLIETITTYSELSGFVWKHFGKELKAEAMFVWDSYEVARESQLLV